MRRRSLLDDTAFAREIAGVLARHRAPAPQAPKRRKRTLEQAVRDVVIEALEDCRGNVSHAARQLAIPRSRVSRLIKRYGLASLLARARR